ncbi:MAG: transcription termination factor NusA [Mariprofundaceae bacterium]|nr:transcription termination factor NusA [Mariprofundaceae bacterium]
MNVEMLQVADAVAREKSVERELVLEAMEQALKTAARRTYGSKELACDIDRHTGEIHLFHVVTTVEEVADEENEVTLEEAQTRNPESLMGAEFREELPPITLGRIAAQAAKQVLNQKIREAERARIIAEFEPRIGEVITGIVKRVERNNVYLDLGHGEGVMYREDQIPREAYRQGDRVRAYLREVRTQTKGPILFLSRTDVGMLQRLFEQEVPEIQDGLITIQAIARDPGSRSKVAVISSDPGIDPVGSCVGMRGSRVQAVVNELHGERIDIIEWTENPASFVVNALAPAEVERVLVDEESNVIEVAVGEDNLAIAIGRKGQNVRLAADLTGWNIEIMTTGEEQQKRGEEVEAAKVMFVDQLEVSESFSTTLVEEGFISLEDIAYSNVADLASLESMDEAKASLLQNQARNRLLGDALQEVDERTGEAQPLSVLPQMRDDLAEELRNKGIETLDDLAEVSVDELEDVDSLAQEEAKALIIAAREACGWFDES